jgi:hypothetical protein
VSGAGYNNPFHIRRNVLDGCAERKLLFISCFNDFFVGVPIQIGMVKAQGFKYFDFIGRQFQGCEPVLASFLNDKRVDHELRSSQDKNSKDR